MGEPAPGDRLLEFLEVMRRLRVECAWKAGQTHRSLARYLLEETHETLEAIDTGDLAHLREEAPGLGIDGGRIGLFASSANVPLAVWLLMQADRREIRCAVLCCGYMLDLNGATSVADMQKLFPFANPGAGKTMDDVRRDVPLLVVRAGRDQFGVNESLDSFIAGALERDLRVRMINHAGAPHAFDLFEDSEATREIVREILRFMQFHLSGPARTGHFTS